MTTIVIPPKVLREKLGDDATQELVELINKVAGKEVLWEETKEIRAEIASTKLSLSKEIANTRADLIKWMFIFWVSQLAATTGIIAMLLKR